MPSLKDVASVTNSLEQLASRLHTELTDGDIDFDKMEQLADGISEEADRLASAFSTMAKALKESFDGGGAAGSDGGRERGAARSSTNGGAGEE
jgi:hypothetical protein